MHISSFQHHQILHLLEMEMAVHLSSGIGGFEIYFPDTVAPSLVYKPFHYGCAYMESAEW